MKARIIVILLVLLLTLTLFGAMCTSSVTVDAKKQNDDHKAFIDAQMKLAIKKVALKIKNDHNKNDHNDKDHNKKDDSTDGTVVDPTAGTGNQYVSITQGTAFTWRGNSGSRYENAGTQKITDATVGNPLPSGQPVFNSGLTINASADSPGGGNARGVGSVSVTATPGQYGVGLSYFTCHFRTTAATWNANPTVTIRAVVHYSITVTTAGDYASSSVWAYGGGMPGMTGDDYPNYTPAFYTEIAGRFVAGTATATTATLTLYHGPIQALSILDATRPYDGIVVIGCGSAVYQPSTATGNAVYASSLNVRPADYTGAGVFLTWG